MINLWPQSQNYFAIFPSCHCPALTIFRSLGNGPYSPWTYSRDNDGMVPHKLHPKAKRKPIAHCTLVHTSLWFIFRKRLREEKNLLRGQFFLLPAQCSSWNRILAAQRWSLSSSSSGSPMTANKIVTTATTLPNLWGTRSSGGKRRTQRDKIRFVIIFYELLLATRYYCIVSL